MIKTRLITSYIVGGGSVYPLHIVFEDVFRLPKHMADAQVN
jgi:hypothetical protein